MPKFATLDMGHPMSANLKVVGVGGGGCNAVESMIKKGLEGVEYIAVNTDAQVLEHSNANVKVQIGKNSTRGLGAGADPEIGKKALEEDKDEVADVLKGADMVFVTTGMGGGTGTGAAPLIASIAKKDGALVVGIVTKPFRWEGKRRMLNAEDGIDKLRQHVDSLIVIPNERLLNILDSSISAATAFDKPNEVLHEATSGIADIITITGIINVDFADVRSVMNESGEALMGCGTASGENRAVEAAQNAISSPLLDGINIQGAKNILLNVSGSENLTMQEIDEGNKVIYDAAGEDANVIFGWVNKPGMEDTVKYTVIATGFGQTQTKGTMSSLKDEKEGEKDIVVSSGFSFRDIDIDDTKVLEEPTIFRVKGSRNVVKSNGDQKSESDIEQLDAFADSKKSIKQEEEYSHEEDSSSFLRMMMD